MEERVLSYINMYSMIPENGNIVAGVSGGPDSVCLLRILVKLKDRLGLKLSAVHINHGLRSEAGEDADFVKELCGQWNVPFVLVEADVEGLSREKKMSCEETGRQVRYEAFEKELDRMDSLTGGNGCIAVAHNRDDRAETLLFHLFRGTGLDGMAGIRPVRALHSEYFFAKKPEHRDGFTGSLSAKCPSGKRIIRPLLNCGRQEIEEYLRGEGVGWRTDATNAQGIYTRNRIRNDVLPYAEAHICEGAKEHLARGAALLSDTADFVRARTRESLERCMEKECRKEREVRLSAARFAGVDAYLQGMCIRECLRSTGGGRDLTAAHIEAVKRLFAPDCRSGKRVVLPICGVEVCRDFDFVAFRPFEPSPPLSDPVELRIGRFDVPGLGTVKTRVLSGPAAGRLSDGAEKPSAAGGEPENRRKTLKNAAFLQNIPEKKYTKWIDYDKIIKSAVFRTRRSGDYLTINDQLSQKSLKRYMIEEKIPAARRGSMMLLADGAHIIWVPGYRISAAYKITSATSKVMEIQITADEEIQRSCGVYTEGGNQDV